MTPASQLQQQVDMNISTHQDQFMSEGSAARDGNPGDGPQRLFTASGSGDKVVGVLITIYQGSSYDENFRTIRPTTVEGEQVSTFSLQCCDVGRLHDYMSGAQPVPAAPSSWSQLLQDIGRVNADAVTLNWECCSECGDQGFPPCGITGARVRRRGRQQRLEVAAAESMTMKLAGLAVRSGFTVMFSDFSLKALISEWSEVELGPNPFVKWQQSCDGGFVLEFLPSELKDPEVPQQLQVVGELCGERGSANVAALGDTIVYAVNPTRAATDKYEVKVLTVVSEIQGGLHMPEALKCSIGTGEGERRGAAGHITLTYAEGGGQLIASMGHWIELTRINTSVEQVMQCAYKNFGSAQQQDFETDLSRYSTASDRYECAQKWSKAMVQQSVPSRMKA